FESWVEEQIQQAQREGAFDNLPGRGKPDANRPYDPDWWIKNLIQREKLSILPPALEARQKLSTTLARIREMADEGAVRREFESLNAEIARINSRVTSGPPTDVGRLDVEAALERWRAERRQAD